MSIDFPAKNWFGKPVARVRNHMSSEDMHDWFEWRAIRDEYRNFLFSQECARMAQIVDSMA